MKIDLYKSISRLKIDQVKKLITIKHQMKSLLSAIYITLGFY